jgi:type VI secretion system protein
MAGMRASFEALLRRFDPRELERTFEERARRGSLLSNRKARNWELYEEYHGQVMREAEDDFQVLYGQAFADAYQAQIDKLQRARVKASRE